MSLDTFIFDMDNVLCEYNVARRLAALEAMTGIPADVIHRRVWGSGFENRADAGEYPDSAAYLEAFCEHMQFRITREQWIEARKVSMTAYDDMLDTVRHLANTGTIAVLTNNVPLLEDTLGEVFPEVVEIFGANIYFSCSLGIGKPDPEIYRQVAGACGTAPERCLFTDDKLENVEGARAAGMQGIHFTAPASFLQQLDVIGVALDWGVNRP